MMIKKTILSLLFIVINSAAVLYLISPTPDITPLPNSVKSDLPGDTVQIPNVSGYFTNSPRSEVIGFYRQIYQSPLRIILNHPPERSKVIFTDTMQSYYLEEFIIPFKETLYINGFEWKNDVFTKPEKRIKNQLEYKDVVYDSKVTIRTFPVPLETRLISFFLLESLLVGLFFLYRSLFKKNHD